MVFYNKVTDLPAEVINELSYNDAVEIILNKDNDPLFNGLKRAAIEGKARRDYLVRRIAETLNYKVDYVTIMVIKGVDE